MAYDTKWDPNRRAACIFAAIARAGQYIYTTLELHPAVEENFLWRLRDQSYANPADEYGDSTGSYIVVEIIAYPIMTRTPCGAWIAGSFGTYKFDGIGRKFVNLQATKQFACDGVDKAIESFVARKRRQHGIYQARANRASMAATMAIRGRYPFIEQGYFPSKNDAGEWV